MSTRPSSPATTPRSSSGARGRRARPCSPHSACPASAPKEDRLRRGDHLRRRADVDDDGGSTWQSLTRGTASEIDYLAGEVVLLGRLNGVPTPVNAAVQALTRQLAGSGGRPRSVDAAAVLDTLVTNDEGPATSR